MKLMGDPLLIAPKGIEITGYGVYKINRPMLLIAPKGIEITITIEFHFFKGTLNRTKRN